MSSVTISIDDRVRLVAAVLAASDWPQKEQMLEPHAVHSQAKLTRQYMAPHREHPAVTAVNRQLANGLQVDDLFAAALRCHWPSLEQVEPLPTSLTGNGWLAQLADFYTGTAVATSLWAEQAADWQKAAAELGRLFPDDRLPRFLARLTGLRLQRKITIVPNLTYPALRTVVVETAGQIFLVMPPPKAFGESPPWGYGAAGAGWALAESCRRLATVLLAPVMAQLDPDQQALLAHGATTLFLQHALDDAEAMAYLVHKRKQYNLPRLAAVVDQLGQFIVEANGRSLADLVTIH